MRGIKLPLQTKLMKAKFHVEHHLLTCILFPKQENIEVIIKEDIIVLWLLTQHYQTNTANGIFSHMIWCKKNHSAELPYRGLITNILDLTRVKLIDKPVDGIHTQINSPSLNKIKLCVFHGELRNYTMEEDEEEAHPISANVK